MLLTIVLTLFAMVVLAALEISLFWQLGERDDRRRGRKPATAGGANARAEQPHAAAQVPVRGRLRNRMQHCEYESPAVGVTDGPLHRRSRE
jgi:hypothetical protein